MRTFIGIVIGIAFVVAVVIGAMGQLRAECEVCIAYEGRQTCEVAHAADDDEATVQATVGACAKLSSGVTDGIQCSNTKPLKVTCSDSDVR